MQVILKTNWFCPGGYRIRASNFPQEIPDEWCKEGILPSSAKIVTPIQPHEEIEISEEAKDAQAAFKAALNEENGKTNDATHAASAAHTAAAEKDAVGKKGK